MAAREVEGVALASPELDIAGITAVAGNVPLELTSKNARIMDAGRAERVAL